MCRRLSESTWIRINKNKKKTYKFFQWPQQCGNTWVTPSKFNCNKSEGDTNIGVLISP